MAEENKLNGGWKQLKKDLGSMTFKQKLDHLWTYYKGSLVVLLIVVMVLSIVTTSCIARNTQTLIAGVGINVTLDGDAQEAMESEVFDLLATGGRQKVYYSASAMTSFSNAAATQDNYYVLMNLLALCSSEELDFVFLDNIALENMLAHNFYADLRNLFSEDEMEALGENVIWLKMGEEDEETLLPVAVKITELPFVQENVTQSGDIYFAVVANTPRLESCRTFWEYISTWTPAA